MNQDDTNILEDYEDELAWLAETNLYLSAALKGISQGEHSQVILSDIETILSITNTLITEIDNRQVTWSDEVDDMVENLHILLNKHTSGPGSWDSYYRNIRLVGDYIDHNALEDRASISHINHIFGPVKHHTDSRAAVKKRHEQ